MSVPERGPFQGVLQIVQYNWPFYVAGLALSGVGIAVLQVLPLPALLALLGWIGIGLALFWTLLSLLASWYVYDWSPLCRWQWIQRLFPTAPQRWANLHTGLDESTPTLRALFPHTTGLVFDFYDPVTMTEPSIRRARALTPPPELPLSVPATALPLANGALDGAFLLFAAHEIREAKEREAFFAELQRVLRPGGQIVLAEHLRNTANFIAFGPGFFHFWPRQEWLRLAHTAGFLVVEEFAITPLVRVFVLERSE